MHYTGLLPSAAAAELTRPTDNILVLGVLDTLLGVHLANNYLTRNTDGEQDSGHIQQVSLPLVSSINALIRHNATGLVVTYQYC